MMTMMMIVYYIHKHKIKKDDAQPGLKYCAILPDTEAGAGALLLMMTV